MLHKCLPVINEAFAMPEVVGDCGFVVPQNNGPSLKHQVERALQEDGFLAEKARRRILKEFPLEKRKAALLSVVNEL